MLRRWNPITKRWEWIEASFAYAEKDEAGQGADDKDQGPSLEAMKAENDRLKKQLDEVGPRIKAMEEADKKRAEELARKDEDRKKKDLGADKVIEERNEQLKAANERLAALEKRERERVDAAYEALPEELREAVAPLRDTLPLEQWAGQVERLAKIAATNAGDDKGKATGMFFKPGGGDDKAGKQVLNPLAKEILENMGRDPDEVMKNMVVKRIRDEESGRTTSRFTRHVRDFFKSMNLRPVHRVSPTQKQ